MISGSRKNSYKTRTSFLVALLCLTIFSLGAQANDTQVATSGWSLLPENTGNTKPIYTLNPLPISAGRIETSSTTPLKLLSTNSTPLFFELQSGQSMLSSGLNTAGELTFASAIGWQPLDQLVVALGLHNSIFDKTAGADHFQPISNIRCESALIEPGKYHASNCRFTDGGDLGGQLISRFTSLGATWAPNLSSRTNTSVQLEYFQQQNQSPNTVGMNNYFSSAGNQLNNNRGLLTAAELGESSKLEGVGVNLALGINHTSMGELQLGLQLSRINSVELNYSAAKSGFNLNPQLSQANLPIAPYNTAAVNFDWRRGSFSGGVQGFYRDPLTLDNQQNTESLTGFDIYFSWHTPWNANLSIGTTNVLNSSNTNKLANDGNDPFELIYGRVPYVRYQQDL